MEEAELLAGSSKLGRVVHTDPDIGSLFAREREPMLAVASLIVGGPALAEEAVQEAFASVHQRWTSIENPGGYLRTCVINNARRIARRRGVETRVLAADNTPQQSVEVPTELLELRDALGRLSANQRCAVVLRYFLDLSDDEIGRELGCRPSTVRSHLRRALSRLRKELE